MGHSPVERATLAINALRSKVDLMAQNGETMNAERADDFEARLASAAHRFAAAVMDDAPSAEVCARAAKGWALRRGSRAWRKRPGKGHANRSLAAAVHAEQRDATAGVHGFRANMDWPIMDLMLLSEDERRAAEAVGKVLVSVGGLA